MSGNPESSGVDESLTKLEEALDAYESEIKTNAVVADNEIEDVLGLVSRRELRTKNAMELGEMSFALEQYSAYVQRASNRQTAIINWCEARLNYLLAELTPKTAAPSYNERKALATRQDSAAKRLYQLKRRAQSRYDTVAYLPSRFHGMAESLKSLQDTKRMYERQNNG